MMEYVKAEAETIVFDVYRRKCKLYLSGHEQRSWRPWWQRWQQ